MTFELVADRRPDEIGTVRVEPFLNHQIDVAKVDIAKIDRDFFCFRRLGSKFPYVIHHHPPSINHLIGWHMDVPLDAFKGAAPWKTGFLPTTKATARRSGPPVPL
jgi:hypothetical protein